MNDYVSKPIDTQQLWKVLTQWGVPQVMIPTGTATQPSESGIQIPEVLLGFDLLSGLDRLSGNWNLYRRFLLDFAQHYAQIPAQIRTLLTTGDLKEGEQLVHRLRGVAANLSANDVSRSARKLEEAIISQSEKEFNSLLLILDDAMEVAVTSVLTLKVYDQSQVDQSIATDISRASLAIMSMSKLLQENSTDVEEYSEELKHCLDSTTYKTELQQLEEHVMNYDFEDGLIVLRKIAQELGIEI